MKLFFLSLACWVCSIQTFAADSTLYIKVHFLYGSKPSKKYKGEEAKWFGGKYGGHVGIEVDSNKVLNFLPRGDFHWFAHKYEKNSKFAIHSTNSFWEIMGSDSYSVKKTSVVIPITVKQKLLLDSITNAYLHQTPYDYALFGMRCGSAGYDILAQLGLLKQLSHRGTYLKIIYPKKLRKRLYKMADKKHWSIIHQPGTPRRVWKVA